ncbi:hypothetical protein B0H17DRAFT_1151078 [Mycena rosella]|uniref:Uncharacterized protein n=1 Tax=Mycena rosella TaxID=1033263 RepID=A0AAD7BNT2_MYCRO|nr:hypothetical protein B0H17DRAFT_1151078 [Mycena rosella]
MDTWYDHEKARNALDMWTEAMKNSSANTTEVVARQDGPRLEAVFTVVGVLKSFDIPPVKKSSARAPYARAYAEIAGYGSNHFARAMERVGDLAYELSTKFQAESVEHWVPVLTTDTYGLCLSSSCRYFTVGSDIQANQWCRSTDRLTQRPSNSTSAQLHSGSPSEERKTSIFCRLVLRTLTFLDGSFAKAAFEVPTSAQAKAGCEIYSAGLSKVAKKRLQFSELSSDEEDIPETRKRMVMMRVEDVNQDAKMPE